MSKLTWDEISKHTEVGDCWIVIEGKVYDVSEFMKRHPGGRWIILEQAGKDATAAFRKTIHSEIAFEKLYELYIGDAADPSLWFVYTYGHTMILMIAIDKTELKAGLLSDQSKPNTPSKLLFTIASKWVLRSSFVAYFGS